jgi:hypothetical protein
MNDQHSKIESLRKYFSAFPDLLERFNEIHPLPPPIPTTLEEVLNSTHPFTQQIHTHSSLPWYGYRHKFMLSCKSEYFLENHMHRLL